MPDEPRWKYPTQQRDRGRHIFLGYIGRFDLYYDWTEEDHAPYGLVFSPELFPPRKNPEEAEAFNWVWYMHEGKGEPLELFSPYVEVVPTPYEMCLFYEAVEAHRASREEKEDA